MLRRVTKGIEDFTHMHRKQSSFQYYLSQFVFLMTLDRGKTAACVHCASVQLYCLRIIGVNPGGGGGEGTMDIFG